MKIGKADTRQRAAVVAEIGNNHEGDMDVAREMIQEAALSGADAVKFQTFRTERYVSRRDSERYKRLKSFELSQTDFLELNKYASNLGLTFFSTPLDLESAQFLLEMTPIVKIASGDNDFFPLLKMVAKSGRPMIVSTGASELGNIRQLVEFVRSERARQKLSKDDFALLHCVSSYPVPVEHANLRAILTLKNAFHDVTIGYSDHTKGIEASSTAVALGARIIEKHFTLDKNYSEFRDHALSADPREMTELVGNIRRVEALLGDGVKRIQPSEVESQAAIRRSIVAKRNLAEGEIIHYDDLLWLRPGGGMPPGKEHLVVGRSLKRGLDSGEQIDLKDVS